MTLNGDVSRCSLILNKDVPWHSLDLIQFSAFFGFQHGYFSSVCGGLSEALSRPLLVLASQFVSNLSRCSSVLMLMFCSYLCI